MTDLYVFCSQLYSKAISAAPGVASYYGNRAAAWLMVGAAKECATDCRRAIQLDSGYVKGYVRLAKALIELSDVDAAEESLRSASTRCPGKKEIEEELQRVRVLSAHLAEGERALSGGEPARALEMYAAALKVTQCAAVQLGCARAEIALGRCDGAMRTTAAVIRAEPGNVRAYAARGHALCLKLDFDQGMKHVREGLRLDPDHAECASLFRRMKRAGAALDRGRTAAGTRDFEAAAIAFTESLDAAQAPTHSPFTAAVLAQRANARLRLKEYDAALVDCAAAIASQEDHKPAYFTQSTALLHLGKPQEAADSLKVLLEMDPGDETVRCVSFLYSFSFYHPLNIRAIRLTSRVFCSSQAAPREGDVRGSKVKTSGLLRHPRHLARRVGARGETGVQATVHGVAPRQARQLQR